MVMSRAPVSDGHKVEVIMAVQIHLIVMFSKIFSSNNVDIFSPGCLYTVRPSPLPHRLRRHWQKKERQKEIWSSARSLLWRQNWAQMQWPQFIIYLLIYWRCSSNSSPVTHVPENMIHTVKVCTSEVSVPSNFVNPHLISLIPKKGK